jgi:hypothetical protein
MIMPEVEAYLKCRAQLEHLEAQQVSMDLGIEFFGAAHAALWGRRR